MAERSTAPRIRIREITAIDDAALGAAHELLRRAFTRAEMLPVADWRNALRERAARLWADISWHLVIAERGARVLAAATGSYLGNVNAGIIGYIAVHPDARLAGIGPRLRRTLRLKFEADARRSGWKQLDALVGEVRADNPWLLHLVRREHALALDFPYYQPSLGGTRDPVELVLYYQPLTAPRRSLSSAQVRRLLYTMWRRVYRVGQPLSHPEFRKMLRALRGRRRIGQRASHRVVAPRATRLRP